MCASRAQSVAAIIRPALERGQWVLCDRFHDATEAYQGGGRGFDRDAIHALHRWLCQDLQPDVTLIFDLDPAVSLARARQRAGREARFEAEDLAFFTRVAQAYRDIAAREPHRCRLVKATGTIEQVEARVSAILDPYALA
jgi:dTMP kinase